MLLELIVLAIAMGWVTGGKPRHLAQVKFAGAELILAAVLLQGLAPVAYRSNETLSYLLHLLSYLLILVALSLNTRTAPIALVAAGIFLNFIVIAFNGGMPVRLPVAKAAAFTDGMHVTLHDATLLPWLGDIIVWPLPRPLRAVVSLGDILLGAGVFLIIFNGMTYVGKRRQGASDL